MLDKIKEKLESNSRYHNDIFKEASILIPLIEIDGGLHIIFEVRAKHLNTQPSEICFPGGKIEADETGRIAAIRETSEELNIELKHINVLNKLKDFHTPFNLLIHPYVGHIEGIPFDRIQANPAEVDELFTVPLDYLLQQDAQCYRIQTHFDIPKDFPFHKIQYGKEYKWKSGSYDVFFYEYKDYIIWGITAKLLRTFLNIIKDED